MKFGVHHPPKFYETKLRRVYEDDNILVIEKPAGIVVFPENKLTEKTLIDLLIEQFPELKNVGQKPRYGIVHRLDRETSGILLVAKNDKTLKFSQKEFKGGRVLKKYLALVVGNLKENQGKIETLIGRSPKDRKKQKVFSFFEPGAKRKGLRKAITEYKVLTRLRRSVAKAMERRRQGFGGQERSFTLIEAIPKTGRKHQIRCHLSYLGHPIAGDKLYGFKNQPKPENLKRHFLHASYLKIKMPDGKEKEFKSELPSDLKICLQNLKTLSSRN